MRPSSPLLDSVRDQFEDYDQLAKDFTRMFLNSEPNSITNAALFDVTFMVGQSKQKVCFGASRRFVRLVHGPFLVLGEIYRCSGDIGGEKSGVSGDVVRDSDWFRFAAGTGR